MLDSELQLFKQDSTTNRLSATRVISGVLNNVWPHVSKAQRLAGQTEWEKLFHKISNDDDETLVSAIHAMSVGCTGDTYMLWAPATQREDVDDWASSPPSRYYGVADVKTDVTSGTATVTVTCKNAAQTSMYVNGDIVFITDKDNPDAATGNTEQKTISGVPVVTGLDVTITVDSNWLNGYLIADDARVYSAPAATDVATSFDNVVDASSIFDDSTYPPVLDNIGTIEETITVTFSDTTNFTVAGDTIGSMGSGDTTTDFIWTNTDWSKPGFEIEKESWEGSPAATNTVSFQIHPAAYPMGFKKVTPAAAASITSELHRQEITGESPT